MDNVLGQLKPGQVRFHPADGTEPYLLENIYHGAINYAAIKPSSCFYYDLRRLRTSTPLRYTV